MAILKSYLTSIEPDMDQSIYSQSIGGYCSNSLLYPETTVAETVGLYDTSISLNTPYSGGWDEWSGVEFINIGNEVIKVSPIVDGSISVVQRGYNGIINMHISGDSALSCGGKELFNNVFNDEYKQYRCIAVRNDSSLSDTSMDFGAYNFGVFLRQNSRSVDSSVRIALEKPKSQYFSSSAAVWSPMSIVDSSLIGLYEDNHFKDAYLRLTSGDGVDQGKLIGSFDSSSGTLTFYNSFSLDYDYSEDISYEILPSPSQRIKTGIVSPVEKGSNTLFPFVENNEGSVLKFFSGDISDMSIGDLSPNDVVYIWMERTIEKGSSNFNNNDIVLNIQYNTSE